MPEGDNFMLKRWLLALVVACAPISSPAYADPSPPAAAEMDAHRAFADWLTRLTGVLDRAGAANEAFNGFFAGYDPNANREVQLQSFRRVREHANGARQLMSQLGSEVDAMAPFSYPGAPSEYDVLSRTILSDTSQYIRNMDGVLDLIVQTVDAIESEDTATLRRLAPQLVRSAGLLVQGQVVMLRARQQIVPSSESSHHSLGAMVAMYEGMYAMIMPNVGNRSEALNAAARSAEGWGRSGRARLALARAEAAAMPARQRDIWLQMCDLEETFFAENDRVVALLQNAARDAAAGVSEGDLNIRYTPQISQVETRYQEINSQQVALFSQLTR